MVGLRREMRKRGAKGWWRMFERGLVILIRGAGMRCGCWCPWGFGYWNVESSTLLLGVLNSSPWSSGFIRQSLSTIVACGYRNPFYSLNPFDGSFLCIVV